MLFNGSGLKSTGGNTSVRTENEFGVNMLREKRLGDIQQQRSGRKNEIRTRNSEERS